MSRPLQTDPPPSPVAACPVLVVSDRGEAPHGGDAADRNDVSAEAVPLQLVDDPAGAEPSAAEESTVEEMPAIEPEPDDLPVWLRITLIVLGVVLLAVGVAGLVLPGLQGILTILLGLALLSLVSSHAYRFLRWCLSPWPSMLQRVERHRHRMFGWINHKLGGVGASAVGAEEAGQDDAAAEASGERQDARQDSCSVPRLALESHRVGDAAVPTSEPALDLPLDETLDLERRRRLARIHA